MSDKPELHDFLKACPEIDEGLLIEHLSRLSDRYFKRFSVEEICRHLGCLSRLSTEHPLEILLDSRRDGTVGCTILAFDYPSEFSLLTGILTGKGFSILSGDVFTYERVDEKPSKTANRKRIRGRNITQEPLKRRRIIDYFSGDLDTPLSFKNWAGDLKRSMEEIIGLLERGGKDSVTEAKHRVNEMVVKRLVHLQSETQPVLYPVQIEIEDNRESYTTLKVISEDTPGFLYALTNALSLHDILIEHVKIRTIHGRIQDQLDLVNTRGRAIEDPHILDQVKFSVLLTKQFTYFLGKAPEPYKALARFEHLVKEILSKPLKGDWVELLTNPKTLRDLARLLGASDFLWEDFIRLQYETLLPMLTPHIEERRFSEPAETMTERLEKALKGVDTFEEQKKVLNEFKDREIFLIDLDHILNPFVDFRSLSERLTRLAEDVVNMATKLVYDRLVNRFGQPGTVAGIEARFAILGLGKLGGAALGYASDIEILFVYSDNGKTDGPESIGNAEFFDRLVKEVNQFITAKREGIFHIDLRLRPYGSAGPLACSLESFCRYYGQGGKAHSYERLALVRLRAIGGDTGLGRRLERLRDEMIYFSRNIDLHELRELREKQFREKTKGGKLNAKFSPGGLVDLEYSVQILQVLYGKDVSRLRTPRIHEALAALGDAGVLSPEETVGLVHAYNFLRNLINGMRMLRGSAKDLFLPPTESDEFAHLARRMGYERGGPLEPPQQLYIEFETDSAAVRAFVERHFGRDSLPGPGARTVADLILSDGVYQELRSRILSDVGFKNPERAYVNLKGLAGQGTGRETFARLALLACDVLAETPDPDMALNNWERFIRSLGSPEFHYKLLLSQPMRLEILLGLFSGSQFLADTLVRNPGFLDWVIIPEILHGNRKREDFEEELRKAASVCRSHREWLDRLRRFRRREILRIGTRDICLGISTREIMLELSMLAESCIQVVFERVVEWFKEEGKTTGEVAEDLKSHFCILAMGKLGGNELNYSSDIDLIGLWDESAVLKKHGDEGISIFKELFSNIMERVRSDLSSHNEEGYAYRVDLRLRPFGSAGELVSSISGLRKYYGSWASLWEIQAALKMRPVAGDLRLGYHFTDKLRSILLKSRRGDDIVKSIEGMRQAAVKASKGGLLPTIDVKTGYGGLRDVEFLVQGLQLIHGSENPSLLEGNTLIALDLLQEYGILQEGVVENLKGDYIFLRRIEHAIQILEDRQSHSLPKDPRELSALAKRILGSKADTEQFMEELKGCLNRIRDAYRAHLSPLSPPVA